MFDYVCVFSTGGVLLWQNQIYADFKMEFINLFIKTCLLEQNYNTQVKKYCCQDYALKWQVHQELKLVFAVVYKEILQLAFVEQFLEMMNKAFVGSALPRMQKKGDIYISVGGTDVFLPQYEIVYSKWDAIMKQQLQAPKKMKSFSDTTKGKKLKGKPNQKMSEPKEDEVQAPRTSTATLEQSSQLSNESDAVKEARQKLKKRYNKSPKTAKPNAAPVEESDSGEENKKEVKQGRTWHTISTKVDKRALQKVDVSEYKEENSKVNLEAEMEKYLGGENDVLKGFLESDDEPLFDSINPLESKPQGIFSRMANAFQSVTGNKQLTREDMDPVLRQFAQQLMDKNVAQDVATDICRQVEQNLLNQRTQTFTSVKTTIRQTLEVAISKLLTPKRHIDILSEALHAKKQGRVFSITFIGVNGVGKSTSLAKMAYYLRTKGNLKVMLAGCDNFRSGAIEQLATHAACLNIPLYERGYGDDPSIIAKEALTEARNKNFDVVLIDTAGRMQGNEKLMRQLAKLVHINQPDVVLFVGEALVGNDAIDQLTKFNQSLIDFAVSVENPRTIDGIILTKFDTVDEKVGTALNMVHTTGKPIVFVGVGQKYPHLKKLNVATVINALMSS